RSAAQVENSCEATPGVTTAPLLASSTQSGSAAFGVADGSACGATGLLAAPPLDTTETVCAAEGSVAPPFSAATGWVDSAAGTAFRSGPRATAAAPAGAAALAGASGLPGPPGANAPGSPPELPPPPPPPFSPSSAAR